MESRRMRVLVWGLGYVGTVSAACLAELGHEVTGVEPHRAKVDAINAGRSPIREPNLEELIHKVVASGRLKATQDGASVIANADISLICVGTPSAADGGQNLNYLRNVATEIGRGLRQGSGYHVVVVRSTLFPGTTRGTLRELLEEHSGRRAGADFGLASNPEFMRETSAINDFLNPPYTVIGEFDQRSGDRVRELYQGIDVPIYRVALEEAEVLKMTNNAFHAVKVGFANEIGRVCARLGIDSHVVMGMVCADTKLNISPAYLKPGFAIGGSCLPKDLRSSDSDRAAPGSGVANSGRHPAQQSSANRGSAHQSSRTRCQAGCGPGTELQGRHGRSARESGGRSDPRPMAGRH